MANSLTFLNDELASDYTLLSTSTDMTDIGLEISYTSTTNEWVEVRSQGYVKNAITDNHSILVQITIDGTGIVTSYLSDGITTVSTQEERPYYLYKKLYLPAGDHVIKVQADNNQGSNVDFEGGTTKSCILYVKRFEEV